MNLFSLFRRQPLAAEPVEGSFVRSQATAEELIEQYRIIHREKPDYGRSSERLLNSIQVHLEELGPIESILDYGCGRSKTVDWLAKLNDAKGYRFDPAIPEFQNLPVLKADVVINTDVLEHIPEAEIDDFLARIGSISQRAYFQIATDEAHTVLPNGENAHCTIRPEGWWREKLKKHFKYIRRAKPHVANRISYVTWPVEAAPVSDALDSFRDFANELAGQDCIVFGSAPNPTFEGLDISGKKIVCCNGSALTLRDKFGLTPDFTFIHSHVPWRVNNPADRDVREALAKVGTLGKLVILFHPTHTYDPKSYEHQTTAIHALHWGYRFEIIRRLTGSSVAYLDLSTGATAVASVVFAGARSISLVGFSFGTNGHSYNNKKLHRAHISSDAALYTLLHASGTPLNATDPSVQPILVNTLS
ncbi:hypothetical protein [Neoaquamicrobium sediminum]|uniref:hypothetical protein n=1 Tax=Neoaquamicrobium sediminum TaxID=1849104 RepID=UPI003BAA4AFE